MNGGSVTGDPGPLVAIVDYGIGNLRSVQKSFQRVGARAELTSDRGLIADAAAVVLPGVGGFGSCVTALAESGLTDTAVEAATSGRPFFGICVGMQMLFEGSDESPDVPGLGLFPGRVRLLPEGVRRPQMQWNQLSIADKAAPGSPESGSDGAWMYFVHSFAAELTDDAVAVCDYGGPVTAAVRSGALLATQFHPEKSGRDGLALLERFVDALEPQ